MRRNCRKRPWEVFPLRLFRPKRSVDLFIGMHPLASPCTEPLNTKMSEWRSTLQYHIILHSWLELKESWSAAERVLLICGQDTEREAAREKQKLLQQWSEPVSQLSVWYETISNTEFEAGMSCIDRFIIPMSSKEEKGFRPDLLLSMGGEWVSRKVKKWLRSFPEVDHWHIDLYRHPDLLRRSFGRFMQIRIIFCKKASSIWLPVQKSRRMQLTSVNWLNCDLSDISSTSRTRLGRTFDYLPS